MILGTDITAAEPIAIVGVGCKLPGNICRVEDLFAALRDGRLCVTKVPIDRWDADAYYDPDPVTPGKTYVQHGGFVDDIDRFDAAFFGISDGEAARMDPQQRMALQTVWHAIEHAGQSAEELLKTNTGVFLAMMNTNGYAQLKGLFEGLQGITAYDAMGDAMSITAGRISHFLGLEGPCLAVDTACSGSMVAVHLARQSILAGDCDSAIVVGVNAILHPGIHIAFSKVGLMSRAGNCRAFDEAADGYVRGEGCIAVVLRRESAAVARGDRILASIIGTAINQDGRTPALTAPNGLNQEKVIRSALARVGVAPNEVGYVEAHGTGTPVGDPIEMGALANVYGPDRAPSDPLFVGSAKTNFGHLESAGGLLGLVKAALSLHHETVFPSLHFNRLNPNIDLGLAPIEVPTTAIPWRRNGRARVAGVNSFGYSGTNAHALLNEAPVVKAEGPPSRPSELVVLSAKSAASLQDAAERWADALEREEVNAPLCDIAFTAATGRTHMRHRLAVVGRDSADVGAKIRSWRSQRVPRGLAAGQVRMQRPPKVAFVFTGQGAQYAGMSRQLYENERFFRSTIDRCASTMDPLLGVPLTEVLFGTSSDELLGDTRYVQPALFALEYALATLLRQWGVDPDILIGHSVGEVVAAAVAGALDLESAISFVVARGRLMGALPSGGKMLAVEATPEEARRWVRGMEAHVSLAAVNGPHSVVVSGAGSAIDAVADTARAESRRVKELQVSHAFHSPLMEPMLDELAEIAAALPLLSARIPIISNLTGAPMEGDFDAGYWRSHVRQPVLFHQGMSEVFAAGCSVVVEVGPHPALIPAMGSSFDLTRVRTVPTLLRDQDDMAHILEAVGALYVSGAPVNFDKVFWAPTYRRVSLPLYPFRSDRHWLTNDFAVDTPPPVQPNLHPLLGRTASLGVRRTVFETSIAATHPWADHRVLGSTVFPGTGYLEMAARGYAAFKGGDWRSVVLRDVRFERPMMLGYRTPTKVRLAMEDVPGGAAGEVEFTVRTAGDGVNETYCRGRVMRAGDDQAGPPGAVDLSPMQSQLAIGQFYGDMRKLGLEYGANFSTIRELWLGGAGSGQAIGRVTPSPYADEADNHPFVFTTMLDGCLQAFGAALRTVDNRDARGAYVPVAMESVTIRRSLPVEVWSRVDVQRNVDGRGSLVRIRALSAEGEVLVDLDGVELRQTSSLSSGDGRVGAPAGDGVVVDGTSESREQLVARLKATPKEERVSVVAGWLAAEVKATMGQAAEDLDLDDLDLSTAFLEIGLDSLLVTELQRRIQEKLEFRFEPMQGLDYQSIESLAAFILDGVLLLEGPAADAAAPPATSTAMATGAATG